MISVIYNFTISKNHVLLIKCVISLADGFYWEGLVNRTFPPPIMPSVNSAIDTANSDDYPPDPDGPPADDESGWDKDF